MKIYLLSAMLSLLLTSCSAMESRDKEVAYRKYLGGNGQEIRFCLEPKVKK